LIRLLLADALCLIFGQRVNSEIEDHWSAKDVDEKSNVQADSSITVKNDNSHVQADLRAENLETANEPDPIAVFRVLTGGVNTGDMERKRGEARSS